MRSLYPTLPALFKDVIIRKDFKNECNAKSFTEMEIDHWLSECSQAALSLIGKRKTPLFQFLVLGLGIQYQNKVFLGKLEKWNQCLAEANNMFEGINNDI